VESRRSSTCDIMSGVFFVLKLHQHQLPSVTAGAVSDRANIVTDLGVSSVVSEATRVVGPSLSVVKVELRVFGVLDCMC